MQLSSDDWSVGSLRNSYMRCRYIGRLHDSLHDFSARFSDIDAICQKIYAAERAQVHQKWWKRLLFKFCGRSFSDSDRILSFMSTLDENRVIEVTAEALGGKLASHFDFEKRHDIVSTASKVISSNMRSPCAANPMQANRSESLDNSRQVNASRVTHLTRVGEIRPNCHAISRSRYQVSTQSSTPSTLVGDEEGSRNLFVRQEFSLQNPDQQTLVLKNERPCKLGRPQLFNMKRKTGPWASPDAWHAPEIRPHSAANRFAFTSVQCEVGGATATAFPTFEQRIPQPAVKPSSGAQNDQNVTLELEEVVVHSAEPPAAQVDRRRSTPDQLQSINQHVHKSQRTSVRKSAENLWRRQNLADLAAAYDASTIKIIASLEHRSLQLTVKPSSGAQNDQNVTTELEEVVVHSAEPAQVDRQRSTPGRFQSINQHVHGHQSAYISEGVGHDIAIEHQPQGSKKQPICSKSSSVNAITNMPTGKKMSIVSDAAVLSPKPEMQIPGKSIATDRFCTKPPLVIEKDFKSGKLYEAKAATCSAQTQSKKLFNTTLGLSQSDLTKQQLSSATANKHQSAPYNPEKVHPKLKSQTNVGAPGSPPPFNDDDLQLAKRREEKALARAAQRSLLGGTSAAVASTWSKAHPRRKSQTEVGSPDSPLPRSIHE
jgi:hypothetical protein